MQVGYLIVGGILGLAVGSFLNVVIYRVPRGLSVVSPPSACPGCHHQIAARDNIPVVSWLMLRGRCRHCAMAISPRYPLVEALTALVFALAAFGLGVSFTAVVVLEVVLSWLVLALGIALAAIRIDKLALPAVLLWPFVIATVCLVMLLFVAR